MVLTFESVDEIVNSDYSDERYWAVLSCGAVCYSLKGGAEVLSVWIKSSCEITQIKATERYFHVVLFIMLYKVVLSFECMVKILKWNHSNERYWAVLFCDAVTLQFCLFTPDYQVLVILILLLLIRSAHIGIVREIRVSFWRCLVIQFQTGRQKMTFKIISTRDRF